MSDITEFTIRSTFAWHCDEHSIVSVNYTNIVNNEFIVNGNRCDSLHTSFRINTAESDISNLHLCSPPLPIIDLVYTST